MIELERMSFRLNPEDKTIFEMKLAHNGHKSISEVLRAFVAMYTMQTFSLLGNIQKNIISTTIFDYLKEFPDLLVLIQEQLDQESPCGDCDQ